MPTEQTVLVVDDDRSIAELMKDFLENDGFEVKTAFDANEALRVVRSSSVHCLLIDVMMPGMDGFELCRTIRAASDVPILFLSARGEDVDKIRGLGIGGDDYIVKTASPSEIVARVKAVLRRAGGAAGRSSRKVDFGRLRLDYSAREVLVDGMEVTLTPKEYELLSLLSEHPRQVFTYERLLERLWEGVGDNHTVRVHVARLREKIEQDPNRPQLLTNVWGVGYRFEGKPL